MQYHSTPDVDDKYTNTLYRVTVIWKDQRESTARDIEHKDYAIPANTFEDARTTILENLDEINPGHKFEFKEIREIKVETEILNPDKLYQI